MKGKKKQNKNSEKLFAFVLFTIACVLGLVYAMNPNVFSSLVFNRELAAAGDIPAHNKNKGENGDGTYKISLDVTGDADTDTEINSKANVLVVYDVSGSMKSDIYKTTTGTSGTQYGIVNGEYVELTLYNGRWYYNSYGWQEYSGTRYVKDGTRDVKAEKVVYDFANALFQYNETTSDAVSMAIVTFSSRDRDGNGNTASAGTASNAAWERVGWTTTKTDITNVLNSTGSGSPKLYNPYSGGTNWEAAMKRANTVLDKIPESRKNEPTYIIFVTDGAPTYRVTSQRTQYGTDRFGNALYTENGVGYSTDDDITNYRNAMDDAKVIQDRDNTTMYGIYAYGTEGDFLDDLISYAYTGTDRTSGQTISQAKATTTTDNYYNASNTEALNAAVTEIFGTITDTLGVSSVSITDGTTQSVKAASGKISHLLAVDEDSYKYYMSMTVTPVQGQANKYTLTRKNLLTGEDYDITLTDNGNGTVNAQWGNNNINLDGSISLNTFKYEWKESNAFYGYAPNDAELDDDEGSDTYGAVQWDLSNVGTLLDGVTYTVEFDVYPTQETYDLIADLKNNKILYTELLPGSSNKDLAGLSEYIKFDNGAYYLETNTNATLTWTDTRNDVGERTESYENPPAVPTNAQKIKITKGWENALDPEDHSDKEVTVIVKKGDEAYLTNILLNKDTVIDNVNVPYTAEFFIATGLMKVDKTAGTIEVLDSGHEYTFKESGSDAYNWELIAETVRPMIINNEQYKLILLDDNVSKIYTVDGQPRYTEPECIKNASYCTVGQDEYYKIDDKVYVAIKANSSNMSTINATNYRRSNLNIKKTVDGEKANADDEFTFKVHIQDAGATDDLWFSVQDANKNRVSVGTITGAELQSNNYYKVPIDNVIEGVDLVFKLKDGYNLRFTNLTTQTEYTVEETAMPSNKYLYKNVNVSGKYGAAETTITNHGITTDTNGKTTGKIGLTNSTYEVEYVNEFQETSIAVQKVWDDANNQDALRGDGATFHLYADGNKVDGKTATLAENGTISFTGLPRFNGKKEIKYTIVEEEMDAYETTPAVALTTGVEDGGTIINKHVPEVIDISVTKKWDDANNQDGKRTNVTFNLNGADPIELDGTPEAKEGESGETEAWVATWKNLPKYANGKEIEYKITEASVPTGYTVSYGSEDATYAKNGGTITNKHTPEVVSVTVTKNWVDDEDRDDLRPGKITFKLNDANPIELDGTPEAKEGESGETEAWVATWRNLPKYADGEVIDYHVTEASVPAGYEVSYGAEGATYAENGGTITNTHTPETVKAAVTKSWNDNNNQDGIRPTSIKVTLTDGKNYSKDVILNAGNLWTAIVTDLPKNDKGKAITYTWTEDQSEFGENYELTNTTPENIVENGVVVGVKTTLTNTHTPETTKVSVTKSWDDNNNQDGKRDKITFKLNGANPIELDGTPEAKEGESGETAAWVATWVNLPKYENPTEESGKATLVKYKVTEASVPTGYTVSYGSEDATYAENGGIIKNTHTPATTKVTITKEWRDAGDQDGKRTKANARVQLYQTVDGKKSPVTGKTAEVPYNGGTVTVFSDLPVYEDGKPITYSIQEIMDTTDYTVEGDKTTLPAVESQDGTMSNSGTISLINKYTPEITEVSVTKSWDDNNNQDGIRDKVTFKLNGGDPIELDGTPEAKEGESGETAAWVATWRNLPKYADGEKIDYHVTEDSVPAGYTVSYGEDGETYAVNGGIIKNTHAPATTKVTVTKKWSDKGDQDGYRSKVNARVQLWQMVDGTQSMVRGKTADVPLTDGEVTVFEGLPVYDNGNQITYYVVETMNSIEGKQVYDIQGTGTELPAIEGKDGAMGDSGTIAIENKHTPDTIDIHGFKKWQDASNQDGMRPNKLIIKVYDEDELNTLVKSVEIDATNATAESADVWEYTVTELPRYKNKGEKIHYIVKEEYPAEPAGADYKYDEEYKFDRDQKDEYILINTHETKTTEVSVKKIWSDENDQDGLRPDAIYLTLFADGVPVDGHTRVQVLPPNGDKIEKTWTYTFRNLDMYSNGQRITYTVAEVPATEEEEEAGADAVPGYSSDIVSTGNYKVEITNTHVPSKLNIKGTKVWSNNDDAEDAMRPDYINVRLYVNGEPTEEVREVSAATGWSFTFDELDEFEKHGQKIGYSVEEEYPEDYKFTDMYDVKITDITKETETVEENNYKVTVTNTYVREYVSITMNKIWDDEGDNDGIRPKYITVNLLADGVKIDSRKVTEADGWKTSFTKLPKYKNKKAVIYTITEEFVDKYQSTTTVNNDNTEFTITNKHDPEKTKISGKKTWQDDEKNLDKRPSTITIRVYADGEYVTTITVSNQTNWQYMLDNLYKFKNGKEITYTIVEDEVEDYTSVINGYDITNIFTGGTGEVVPPNTSVDVKTGNVIIENVINIVYMFLATMVLGSLRRFIKINN